MRIETLNFLKIALAILLFFCLAKLPYGYYQFVRFVSTFCFLYFAYSEINQRKQGLAVSFLFLAILFQPFFKIALGRELWNAVDVIVGVWLMITVFQEKKEQ